MKDNEGSTPLHVAVKTTRTDAETIGLLIGNGADVNAKDMIGNTPLNFAASEGYQEIVKLLISKGANVNTIANNGKTPLHNAAVEGQNEIIEFNRNRERFQFLKWGSKAFDNFNKVPPCTGIVH